MTTGSSICPEFFRRSVRALGTAFRAQGLGRGAAAVVTAAAGESSSRGKSAGGTLTVADSGETVRLKVGQSVRVVLRGGGTWDLPRAAGKAVRRTSASGGYPTSPPARATFRAVRPGTAVLRSMTDAKCLHAQPPCAIAQRLWTVTVIVRRK
jgi:hypothetical protein